MGLQSQTRLSACTHVKVTVSITEMWASPPPPHFPVQAVGLNWFARCLDKVRNPGREATAGACTAPSAFGVLSTTLSIVWKLNV